MDRACSPCATATRSWRLFGEAGFTGVRVEAVTPTLLIGGGGTLEESVDFLLGMGIARGLLGMVGPDGRVPRPSRPFAPP